MRRLQTAAILAFVLMIGHAGRSEELSSITERLNASGIIIVEHPEALEARLVAVPASDEESAETLAEDTERGKSGSGAVRRIGGYRVQVFSDNNARTAKKEARAKAQAIADAFPKYPTYVVYTSPYWRLKVGDFRSRDEAEAAADEIKRAFPAYSREVRVVQDRINQ